MPLIPERRALARILVLLLLTGAPARALAGENDEKRQCADAYERAQELRMAHRLLDAREQLVACSRPSCPKAAVEDCAVWLRQVQAAIPSVVVRVVDAAGAPLPGARVTIDGAPSDAASAGTAVDLDPGTHTIRVEAEGHSPAESGIALREGDRNRLVTFSLTSIQPVAPAPAAEQPSPAPSSVPVPALVAAGIGGVALAGWGYFGVRGLVDRSAIEASGCLPHCGDEQVSAVNREFLVADVSLGVAVVAVAIASWIWLSGRHAAAPVRAAPLVGTF